MAPRTRSNEIGKKTHILGGVRHRLVTSTKLLEDLQTFEIRDDDVVVITYPKSGTTWIQEIISVLQHECDCEKADEEVLRERFMFLDRRLLSEPVAPYIKAKTLPSPRLLKTHLQKHQIPPQMQAQKAKIIFVSRNPKDTAVSYFHFHSSSADMPTYESWDEFLHCFCLGDVIYGNWFEMIAYWWSQHTNKNVLFVKYEEMHQDLPGVIAKVSEFLGWPIPDGKLSKIVAHCSFDSMKSNPKTNYSEHPLLDTKTSPFMRKGTVGDWKNYFTVAQSEAFDKLYEDIMAETGLEFEYEL